MVSQRQYGMPKLDRKRKEERKRYKKRELNELLYTEIVKSGTIRIASGVNQMKETSNTGTTVQ